MEFVLPANEDGLLTLSLNRGKVNALIDPVIEEFNAALNVAENDPEIRAVILSGTAKFFSFGFDIPEFLGYSKESFKKYLEAFSDLCLRLFLFPKPVIAALNGHTMAGGCMIAISCDHRVMVESDAKISLNEITFGSSVFAGSVAILKEVVGPRYARDILFSGKMYSPPEALQVGLVDEIVPKEFLMERARETAQMMGAKDLRAFASIKRLLHGPIAEHIAIAENASLDEFIDIWYSEKTWKNLQGITINK